VSIINSTTNFDGNQQLFYGARPNVANAAGGAAGDAVTTAITFEDQYGNGTLPAEYAVAVTPNQPCFASTSNKSKSGFSVTLTPLAGATLAEGTFDLVVMI
jgi:hypothetical protein